MSGYSIESVVGLAYENEKIYFIAQDIFAILLYDLHEKKMNIVADFPEDVQRQGAFEKILKIKNKIYLFPNLAEDIYSYDLDLKVYHKLNVLTSKANNIPRRKVLEVLTYKGNVYCVCRCPNIIVRIEPETDNFEVFSIPSELLKENESMDMIFFSVSVYNGKFVYPYADNRIIYFLPDKNMFEVTYLEQENNTRQENRVYNYILGICPHGDSLWMYNIKGEVFEVINNKKNKVIMPEDFVGLYDDGLHEQPGINRMFVVDHDLCFSMRSECKMLKYNLLMRKFTWYENNLVKWNDDKRKIAFSNYVQIDKETSLEYNENDGALYKWNNTKGFTERIELNLSIDMVFKNEYIKNYWLNKMKQRDDIKSYILYIKQDTNNCKMKKQISCGNRIYCRLNGLL